MVDEISVICPHCGHQLYLVINEAGGIALRSFDIYENSETIQLLRASGYEFGRTVNPEGGEKCDE